MKNCIILHGCPSSPNDNSYSKHWIPWTKKQLLLCGIETQTPLMPTPWKPDYDLFKSVFEKHTVDVDTVLVGHSCGSAFLVRWLGETKTKIHKLILVAPWKMPEEKAFYNYKIDKTIKERVKQILIFTSDNEEPAGKESSKIFHKALDAEVIELKNHGHYTLKDMGAEEFPELVEKILAGYLL